jgi:chromosome segregation ATPase
MHYSNQPKNLAFKELDQQIKDLQAEILKYKNKNTTLTRDLKNKKYQVKKLREQKNSLLDKYKKLERVTKYAASQAKKPVNQEQTNCLTAFKLFST